MQPGKLNRWVTLWRGPITSNDSDGFFEALSPSGAWVSIEPLPPDSIGDATRMLTHIVTMRFHDQITVDTRILYGERELFVKGVQNVNDANAELRLYCEEVIK